MNDVFYLMAWVIAILLTIVANGDYRLEMDFTTTGGAVKGIYTISKDY